MAIIDQLLSLFRPGQVELSNPTNDAVAAELQRLAPGTASRPWRKPSVRELLGVPPIHRAVTLISSTVGMLDVEAYRDGEPMERPPSLVTRPDPYSDSYEFYAGTAADFAKYGEFVWWIAARDNDGNPLSLVRVPLPELSIDENRNDRLRPVYRWGRIVSTRWTPATPWGQFVHRKYPLADPYSLRGEGPLQLCGAAASISVEAQEWAANFYAKGGYPNIWLHDDVNELTEEEAQRLKEQWTANPPNTPHVTSGPIKAEPLPVNTIGAQMLDARQHNNGDAARIFGIPGTLLEYQTPGSSLTYQNLEGEFTKFVRVCLQPLYLEPIEAALSDLLTRSTVARFNVDGFLRADLLTRFRAHKLAIDSGIYDVAYAQRAEGILPGDVKFRSVPPAPPAANPVAIPRVFSRPDPAPVELQQVRCPKCSRVNGEASGRVRMVCKRCGTMIEWAA